jgi:hypothetical protein
MKNVTISLDEETHRKARIRAAELGTSLSALVKQYLVGLADGAVPSPSGVRETQAPFKAAQEQTDGPPWLVDGKWVYTKDGKPRKPGALRHLPPLPNDWDEWPAEIEEFFEKLQTEPWDDDVSDPLPFDESQLPPEFRSK